MRVGDGDVAPAAMDGGARRLVTKYEYVCLRSVCLCVLGSVNLEFGGKMGNLWKLGTPRCANSGTPRCDFNVPGIDRMSLTTWSNSL